MIEVFVFAIFTASVAVFAWDTVAFGVRVAKWLHDVTRKTKR